MSLVKKLGIIALVGASLIGGVDRSRGVDVGGEMIVDERKANPQLDQIVKKPEVEEDPADGTLVAAIKYAEFYGMKDTVGFCQFGRGRVILADAHRTPLINDLESNLTKIESVSNDMLHLALRHDNELDYSLFSDNFSALSDLYESSIVKHMSQSPVKLTLFGGWPVDGSGSSRTSFALNCSNIYQFTENVGVPFNESDLHNVDKELFGNLGRGYDFYFGFTKDGKFNITSNHNLAFDFVHVPISEAVERLTYRPYAFEGEQVSFFRPETVKLGWPYSELLLEKNKIPDE